MRGGLLIREARLRAGLTQRALAERLSTTQSVVGRWERGGSRPSLETVVAAVRACGLDLDVRLVPYEEADDGMIAYHLAMSTQGRLASLRSMLDFEARAHTRAGRPGEDRTTSPGDRRTAERPGDG